MTEKKEDTLVTLAKKVEALLMKELDLEHPPGVVILFTEPPKYNTVRYMLNVGKDDGLIMLIRGVKELSKKKKKQTKLKLVKF